MKFEFIDASNADPSGNVANDHEQHGDSKGKEESDHEDLLHDSLFTNDDSRRRYDDGKQKKQKFHGVTLIHTVMLLIALNQRRDAA